MFQNHLLQVVGMIAMEPPAHFRPSAVRNETVKVFDSLRPIAPSRVSQDVVRGQYTGSLTADGSMPGYREEPGVPAGSRTETYVALRFHIDNRRWAGVPFLVRTGKRLPARVTEVVIHFKQVPHHLFGTPPAETDGAPDPAGYGGHAVSAAAADASKLIIRIQPDEAIQLRCNVKLPGAGFDVQQVGMHFRYADLADTYLPDAYERLLLDGITGDATLYARADAIESCWEFVTPDPEGVAGAPRHPPARLPGRKLGAGRRLQPVPPPRLRLAHADALPQRFRRQRRDVGRRQRHRRGCRAAPWPCTDQEPGLLSTHVDDQDQYAGGEDAPVGTHRQTGRRRPNHPVSAQPSRCRDSAHSGAGGPGAAGRARQGACGGAGVVLRSASRPRARFLRGPNGLSASVTP